MVFPRVFLFFCSLASIETQTELSHVRPPREGGSFQEGVQERPTIFQEGKLFLFLTKVGPISFSSCHSLSLKDPFPVSDL